MRTSKMASYNDLSLGACVIKAKLPHLKDESSACGTIVYPQQGVVISHGSIFFEYALKDANFLSKIQTGQFISSDDIGQATFSILLDGRHSLQRAKQQSENKLSVLSNKCADLDTQDFNSMNCNVLGAFRNRDFHSAVCRVMPESNWLFSDSEQEIQSSDNNKSSSQLQENSKKTEGIVSFHLMSYFVILKCEALISSSQNLVTLPNSMSMSYVTCQECHIGQTAELISTPFGALCPSVFFNSYSRGVICNVSGRKKCWIITDARCIPGSEGGPLFVKHNPQDNFRYLSGIITSALCWKNNEWIGFSVACSIESVHQSILENIESYRKPLHHNLTLQIERRESNNAGEDALLSSTVLVQVGSTWGSGIIIDKNPGTIITCSHVVKDADHSTVLISPYKSSFKYPASVVYRQKSLKGPYDIAVLRCEPATSHLPSDWSMEVSPPSLGQEVSVIGHGVFNPDLSLEPSCCKGVVSKIITHQAKPVLLQTTCAVHPGVSGGPLFSSDGKLMGIVICNTKDSSSNTSFPNVNMSVPFYSIWPTLQHYLQTGNKEILSALMLDNPQVSRLWALGNTSSESCLNRSRSKL